MGFLGRLFGASEGDSKARDPRVARMVERVLDMHGRLRMATGCEARLAKAIAPALVHIDAQMGAVPHAHAATTAAWSSDPYMRAYFAAADDIGPALARSQALHAFFDAHPGAASAYAVLGMAMDEHHTFGVASVEGQTRSDVRQTTLDFSDHQIRLCGADEPSLREEVAQRMVDQIAIEGLALVAADTSLREDLEQERALLAARLRLLERQGRGMHGVVGSADASAVADTGELARVQAEVAQNDQRLQALGARSQLLSRQLQTVCDAFARAPSLLQVSTVERRIDRMNMVVQGGIGDVAASQLLSFKVARVPGDPPRERAFGLLRVARADVPPAANLLDDAERLL